MKSWTLRFRTADKKNFDEIKDGLKVVETRAATKKYKNIKVGDILIFACGKERLSKRILAMNHFVSIDEMVKLIPFKNIMPSVDSVFEMKKVYLSYPSYDKKIKESGIFAFELD